MFPGTASLAMFGLPGGVEWIVILIVALLLFGRRLPEIMRGLGGSVREFKHGLDEGADKKPAANPPPTGAVSRSEAATEIRPPDAGSTAPKDH